MKIIKKHKMIYSVLFIGSMSFLISGMSVGTMIKSTLAAEKSGKETQAAVTCPTDVKKCVETCMMLDPKAKALQKKTRESQKKYLAKRGLAKGKAVIKVGEGAEAPPEIESRTAHFECVWLDEKKKRERCCEIGVEEDKCFIFQELVAPKIVQ